MFFKVARQGQNQWYWYLLTLFLAFFIGYGFIGALPLLGVAMAKGIALADLGSIPALAEAFADQKNLLLALMLFIFIPGVLFLWIGVKFFHKRPFKSILTAAPKFRWGRFWFGFAVIAIAVLAITAFDYYSNGEDYVLQFDAKKWIPLFIIGLLLFPIQTGFEEFVFRGYMMQGLGELVKNRWFPLIVTSLLFGLMHSFNPEVAEHGFFKMMPYYMGVGLFLGIITLLDNGLELAWGYHFANNFISSLLVTSPESAIQVDSILRTKEPADPAAMILPMLLGLLLTLGVFWLRYRWKNWGQLLAGKVETDHVIDSPSGNPRLV